MDDTQQSRTSDAAATRKRRSSILKSQRAPRAPLSELEFHVATPTDAAKSRRVSFSRRTGVAEFVTNEATTTWKNFYEEHNRTLESSGNESEVKAPRPSSVGHLGKRIFEDQFQDCEAIDFGSSSKAEYNNIALDSITDDRNLPTPQQNFELSAVTTTNSKLFDDNFAISRLGEITDKIDVDFSIMQPMGDDLDEIQKDLERVANNPPNVMCQGPVYNMSEYIEVDLNATHGGLAADDAASDDMSITDTIHSPKVNVSSIAEPKDKSLDKDWVTDKENIAVNPYIAPKETNNFAINEESDKVLVFDGKRLTIQTEKDPLSDYRKTLLPKEHPEKPPQRKTIVLNVDDDLPNFVANPHASMMQHSQNISLSITANEEFDVSLTQPIVTQPMEAKIDHKQLSMHENVNTNLPLTGLGSEKRKTIVYESDSADISMTQALPSNVIFDAPLENDVKATVFEDEIVRKEKRNTIVFETGSADVSMTLAVPANIILNIKESSKESPNNTPGKRQRRTIVFDNEAADISVTQALSANVILNAAELPGPESKNHVAAKEKRRTIVFENDTADISVTQALPANVILGGAGLPEPVQIDKRKTIVFENDAADISVTQALPANVILNSAGLQEPVQKEKRKTIVFENDAADISVTQALPANVILSSAGVTESAQKEKRKTIMFENDAADISVTQALPANVILNAAGSQEPVQKEKRKTIVFENDAADISVTQALPANVILNSAVSQEPVQKDKRKTIVFENDAADISVTQALPVNVILSSAGVTEPAQKEKRKTIMFENDAADISVTQALPANVILNAAGSQEPVQKEKRKTIVFENHAADISVTQALSANIILGAAIPEAENEKMVLENQNVQKEKRKTVVFENDDADILVTQALSANVILNAESLHTQEALDKENNFVQKEKRKTIVFESDSADISMTQALPANFIINEAVSSAQEPANKDKTAFDENNARSEKRKTVVFDSDSADISMTQALPSNFIIETNSQLQNQKESIISEDNNFAEKSKRKTIVFDNDAVDISMTEVLPSNMILEAAASEPEKTITANKRKTIVYDGDSADVSMTQVVPANVILSVATLPENKIKAIVFDDETAKKEKRKTVVFENDAADISMTKALPANVIINAPGSPIQEPPSKRKTIVFNNEEANISLSQPLPVNYVITEKGQTYSVKRKTIVYETDVGSISMIEVVPPVKSVPEKSNMTVFDETEEFLSRTKTITASVPPNVEMGVTYDVLPQRLTAEANKTYSISTDLDTSKKNQASPANKISSNITTAGGDDDSFNLTQAIPSNIIFGNETRKLEAELELSAADISVPANLIPSENDKHTESLKKEAVTSSNEQGKVIEEINSKTSGVSPTNIPKSTRELSSSELDVIENTEPIPKKSMPPLFAPNKDKNPPALILQDNSDALSKTVNMDVTRGADIVVYQAAISGNQLAVHKNEIEYASSDLTESGSSNESCRDRNVFLMSESSDMEQKEFKEASKSTSAPSLSGASVPSVMDKSCSVIKIDASPAKPSILDSLLDMDDSLISRELLDKGLSTIEVTSPVCVARATSPAQSEEVFRVTREKENETKQSGDAEKQRNEATKKTVNDSGLLATSGRKHSTTPSSTKSPGKPSPDSAKKESPKRNRFFEKFTRHSKGKPRNQNDTADLLDLITKFADKSDYEETKRHGIKAKIEEKAKHTIKEESAKKESPVRQTNANAAKRPSITRSPEKLTRQNSVAVPKRQSIIDTQSMSRRASLAVRRQSIVLSREEILNNISMAAQALRETNSPDITEELPPSPDPEPMEVVKILNFDDDETPEHDYNSPFKSSPLKKTFDGTKVEETRKKSVIPSFCENVSDGVKSLMMDLIKPMADTLPFDVATDGIRDRGREIGIPSNLIATGNVDIESDYCASSEALAGTLGISKNQEYIVICDEMTTSSSKSEEEVWYEHHHGARNDDIPTVVFDPHNPLNNVLLKPRCVEIVHRYNPDPTPIPSALKLEEDQKKDNEVRFKSAETGGVKIDVYDEPKQYLTNFNVQSIIPDYKTADMKNCEISSNKTAENKPVTADASVITCSSAKKDQKVNTVIAMQKNANILRENPSLTIKDNHKHTKHSEKHHKHGEEHTKNSEKHHKHSEEHTNNSQKYSKHSEKHSKDMEKHNKHGEKHSKDGHEHTKHREKHNKEDEKHNKHSERHKNHNERHTKQSENSEKHNKHSEKHSRHSEKHNKDNETHNKHSERETKDNEKDTEDNQENALSESNPQTTEDTYKRKHSPVKKLPEHFYTSSPLSDLPIDTNFIHDNVEGKFTAIHERSPAHKKRKSSSPNNKKTSPKSDVDKSRNNKENVSEKNDIVKPKTEVTVHHCVVLNSMNSSEPNLPQQDIIKSETESRSDGQCLSGKSVSSETLSDSGSRAELVCKAPHQDNVDVYEAIRNLPCMSSPEVCSWEAASGEQWRFLLLHGRLALTINLSPEHSGARLQHTGAHTPVTSVDVLPALVEEKRSGRGELCVRFLLETIRAFISEHRCAVAGELPALVRRCGAAATAAMRWASSMHHAWAHLAYKLDCSGLLTLTVANFPMRHVWEVRMKIELWQGPAHGAPFPRAAHVAVDNIFGDYTVDDKEVQSVMKDVKPGWGHAPATLWKIFKHLKHKTDKSDLI